MSSPTYQEKKPKTGGTYSGHGDFVLVRERERERLLSRFPGNPTVKILRSKKESFSTHRGLRVGTGFGVFDKLRE